MAISAIGCRTSRSTPAVFGSNTTQAEISGGLSLGGGVVVVGERQGDNANDFQLPAYARVDAAVIYRFQPGAFPWVQNLTAQLNVKNLFNTTCNTRSLKV